MIYTPIGTFKGIEVFATESEPGDVCIVPDPDTVDEQLRPLVKWFMSKCGAIEVDMDASKKKCKGKPRK